MSPEPKGSTSPIRMYALKSIRRSTLHRRRFAESRPIPSLAAACQPTSRVRAEKAVELLSTALLLRPFLDFRSRRRRRSTERESTRRKRRRKSRPDKCASLRESRLHNKVKARHRRHHCDSLCGRRLVVHTKLAVVRQGLRSAMSAKWTKYQDNANWNNSIC